MARYRVFSKNMRRVEWSNIKTHGVTKFMDMTPMEFQRKYLNLKISVSDTIRLNNVKPLNVNAPEKWDWRDEGCVNHVKDQGSCGSCWAFASTANMEGQYYLKTKKAITLSEQQLVDCDTIDQGCNGGLMENTFQWLIENGGIMSDKDYRYTSFEGSEYYTQLIC